MSVCVFTKAILFIIENKRSFFVPTVILMLAVGLVLLSIPGPRTFNAVFPSVEEGAAPLTGQSICTDHIVVNLGTYIRRSIHCLLFCLEEESVGLFPCRQRVGRWGFTKVVFWANASLLASDYANCTTDASIITADLCRIPYILSALRDDGN